MVESKSKQPKSSGKEPKEDAGNDEPAGGEGAMITSLCWVSRGFAKAIVDEDENMEEHVVEHSKMIKKLAQ